MKFVAIGLFSLSLLFGGCTSEEPMKITELGPLDVELNKDFNIQPGGYSAIWSKTENATPGSVFVLDGVELQTAIYPDGKGASAVVPKNLYSKPGKFTIYLIDKKSGVKSNELIFTVK